MNKVINNNIPADQADVAYIMSVMTKVAEQQRTSKDGEENRDEINFKLKLDDKSAVCIWHCLNINLANSMVTDQGQQVFISQLMSKLAIKLDQVAAMKTGPTKLLDGIS
jgi:hypothetical protein